MAKSDSSPQEGLQRVEGYKPTRARAIAKPGHGWQATQATGVMSAAQFGLDFYAGPPSPGDRFFMAFTLDHDEGAAAVVFARRYGRPPEFVFESRGNLLCGPIPGEVL